MRSELYKNIMTLYFVGELNSYNADDIDKEIDEAFAGKTFDTVNLDFSGLKYISSAGLRIILKIKQKYNDTHIIEASLEVYDVLNMTGFTNIMDVKKALKVIDVSNAQVIGEGFFSTVYRINKDTIVKVFKRTSDPGQIERELRLAKQAFVLGVPTAISFDIVKADGKLGVRFEMLDCISLKNDFKQNPDQYDSLLKKYIDLLKKINTTDCMDSIVPNIKQFYFEKLEICKQALEDKYYQKCLKLLTSIPDRNTFVHGDCHFKNIMVQGDDFLLIDMDTLSRGHPIFELSALRCPYVAFEEDEPGNSDRFLDMPGEFCAKLYNDIVNGYFGKDDPAIKDKIAIICYIHMVWWTLTNQKENDKRLNGCKGRLISLLDRYDDVDIGI